MKTDKIKTAEPFNELFPIDEQVLGAVVEHMADHGYDKSQPVTIWKGRGILLDGHTRLQAAITNGLEDVPAVPLEFDDEDAAIEYAIHNQRDRRNLTDADLVRCVEALDRRHPHGGDRKSNDFKASPGALKSKTAERTAEMVGTSARKVEKIRTVLEHADPAIKDAVKMGGTTVNKAYTDTQEKRRLVPKTGKSKAVFNRTNSNVDWAWWTTNPVTGCRHECAKIYCYAEEIATRFYTEHGFEPTFHEYRLAAPQNTPLPDSDDPGSRCVFVCSMGDLFGDWVPHEWIDAVLESVRAAPEWTFLFLTKNPARMVEVDWPENAWVGTTVDVQARVKPAQEAFQKVTAPVRFVSVEPFRERIEFGDLSMFDWVIVGAQSKTSKAPEFQPDWEWVEGLLVEAREFGCRVYFKPNLKATPKEYPTKGPS